MLSAFWKPFCNALLSAKWPPKIADMVQDTKDEGTLGAKTFWRKITITV